MGKLSAVLKKLDMSHKARMQRADEQGFDTGQVWYHGSADEISELDKIHSGQTTGNNENEVFYFTQDKGVAETYSREAFNRRFQDNPEQLVEEGIIKELPEFEDYDEQYDFVNELALNQLKTHPSYTRAKNPLIVDWEGQPLDHERANAIVAYAKSGYDETGLIDDIVEQGAEAAFDPEDIADHLDEIKQYARENYIDEGEDLEDWMISDATREVLFDAGIEPERYGSVVFKNIIDDIGEGSEFPQTTMMTFEPEDIRSTSAAFDPANINSADLLGKIDPKLLAATAAVSTAAALAPFIAKRQQRPQSILNKATKYVEPAMMIGSAMGGEVLAGLGGAVTAPFVGADKAAGFVEHLQENIPTYTPRTQTGTQGMIDMGQFLQDTQDNIANSRYGPALQQAQTNFNVSADYLNKNYGPEAATALKLLPDLIL